MQYAHGGDLVTYAAEYGRRPLDFSANINPLGMPQSVREAAIAAMDSCLDYPDPYSRALREAIGVAENVAAEHIFAAAGAADAIFRLAVAIKPRCALVTAPSFSEYGASLDAVGCKTTHHALHEADGFAVTETFLGAIDGMDIVYLCNPNNPTGVVTPLPQLLQIAEKCAASSAIFVLDECFNDFTDECEKITMKPYLQRFANLVILKSFTKMYAMPGLRLGYCMCSDAALLRRLYDCGAPWAVSPVAAAAGIAALGETDYPPRTREFVGGQRRALADGIRALGFTVFDGAANFLLIKNPLPIDLRAAVAEHGILIRSCVNYVGLSEQFYRVAVRTEQENARLIVALEQIVEQNRIGGHR